MSPMPRSVHQIIPLVILFGGALVALFVVRAAFVPDTFGDKGHYRAAAIDDNANRDISYVGSSTCWDCHDEIYELKLNSNHRTVACEVCHGPAVQHVDAPDEVVPDAPRGRGYCPLCHGYNASRPSGFPQILPQLHNPGKACMTCHNPHDPVLPHAPEECSACHREIASKKMVSHHAALNCTTCHEVPKDHWENPRMIRAKKPESKQVCGKCHSKTANSPKEIPRINMENHGDRYLCWDCHYPHFPEAL